MVLTHDDKWPGRIVDHEAGMTRATGTTDGGMFDDPTADEAIGPAIVFDRPAWHDTAICAGMDGDLFFDTANEVAAVALCAACPVRLQCRDYARTNRERYGVWGSETQHERAVWLRRNRT